MEDELSRTTHELDAKQIDMQKLEKELNEMRDRNAALEEQLLEYAGTMSDQSKVIHVSH